MGNAAGCAFCKDKTPVLDINDKVKFMKQVKLFKTLDAKQIENLSDTCTIETYRKGTVIYHQGDYGAELFIIASGTVAVSVEGDKVAYELTTGDHFGENALLRDIPRTVTVTTENAVTVLKVTRQKFQEMDLHLKLDFQKRKAVAGHASEHLVKTQPASAKTEEEVAMLVKAIAANKNLKEIVDMDEEQCQGLCDVAWEQTVEKGEKVIEQGSTEADYFYIVKSGTFEVDIDVPDDEACNDDHAVHSHVHQVGMLGPGGSFGELALLTSSPRFATVSATEASVLWVVDRNAFKRGCARKADHYAKIYSKYIQSCAQFTSLKDDERMSVARALMESNFDKDENIYSQGEDGTAFYILYEGEVAVFKDGKELAKIRGSTDKVEIFGDVALINGEAYQATVQITSETAKTLSMDKDSFEMLLGPMAAINSRGKDGGNSMLGQGSYAAMVAHAAKEGREKIYYDDLKTLGLLGCGGFGLVELVEHKKTKATYAMKTLSKGYCLQNGQQGEVLMEKNVQVRCDSDFIVRLYETYNGEQNLYLLLELGLGGELYATYANKKFWGSEPHAQYYTAGVVFAFEHMHRKKMIYRDLKPENILFNEQGHSKLTDMGLATICPGKTYTTCGTADYMAPEVINATGHMHAVDWWTLGILTFELMTGHPPFAASSMPLIYAKIQKGITQVKFPSESISSMRSYVKAMCNSDPAQRLPMKKGGADNVKNAEWYGGFDWAALKSQKMEPPYVPEVKSKTDLANFNVSEDEKPPQVEYVDDGTGWDADFATSEFKRPKAEGKSPKSSPKASPKSSPKSNEKTPKESPKSKPKKK